MVAVAKMTLGLFLHADIKKHTRFLWPDYINTAMFFYISHKSSEGGVLELVY